MSKIPKCETIGLPGTSADTGRMELDEPEIAVEQPVGEAKPLEGTSIIEPQSIESKSFSDIDVVPFRKPIYSSLSGRMSSSRFLCEINTKISTEIGPYKWKVSWNFNSVHLDAASSEFSRGIVIEVIKESLFTYDWQFQLVFEFEDLLRRPVKKLIDVIDTHETQTFMFNGSNDADCSGIYYNMNAKIQWVTTSVNYMWENSATVINLEDPDRGHDFVLMVSMRSGRSLDILMERTFYVHLSYLRVWFGHFQEIPAPASPYELEEDPDAMSILLSLIHPSMENLLTDDNILKVLYLARKLKVWNVVSRITAELCNPNAYPRVCMIYRFHLGYSFRNRQLMLESLKQIQSSPKYEKCKMVKAHRDIVKSLSKPEMAELLIALVNTVWCFNEKILDHIKQLKASETMPGSECDRLLFLGDITRLDAVNSYVLATWSPFFDHLFFHNPETMNENVVNLGNVPIESFSIILRLIQTKNKLILSRENVCSVLQVADNLKMPSIVAMCCSFIKEFGFDGCSDLMDLLLVGERVSDGYLIDIALNKIARLRDKRPFVRKNVHHLSNICETTRNNLFIAIAEPPKEKQYH